MEQLVSEFVDFNICQPQGFTSEWNDIYICPHDSQQEPESV